MPIGIKGLKNNEWRNKEQQRINKSRNEGVEKWGSEEWWNRKQKYEVLKKVGLSKWSEMEECIKIMEETKKLEWVKEVMEK